MEDYTHGTLCDLLALLNREVLRLLQWCQVSCTSEHLEWLLTCWSPHLCGSRVMTWKYMQSAFSSEFQPCLSMHRKTLKHLCSMLSDGGSIFSLLMGETLRERVGCGQLETAPVVACGIALRRALCEGLPPGPSSGA